MSVEEGSDVVIGDDAKGGERSPVADLSDRLDRLVDAVQGLVQEVEGLGNRLENLERSRSRRSRSGSGGGRRRGSPSESIEVVMRPLPELAMAAVAERALRKAETVEAVTRAHDELDGEHAARYRVEVSPGSNLVDEIRKTLPVPFSACEDESGVVSLDLNW